MQAGKSVHLCTAEHSIAANQRPVFFGDWRLLIDVEGAISHLRDF